jgi:hypothetical protein
MFLWLFSNCSWLEPFANAAYFGLLQCDSEIDPINRDTKQTYRFGLPGLTANSTPTNWPKLIRVHTISTRIRLWVAAPGTAFPLTDASFVFLNWMYTGNAVLSNVCLYPYVPKLAHEREAWQLWQNLNSILLLPEVNDTQSALFRLSLKFHIFLCSCPNKVSRIRDRESSL